MTDLGEHLDVTAPKQIARLGTNGPEDDRRQKAAQISSEKTPASALRTRGHDAQTFS